MLRFSDSRNFAKSLAGLGLILGPVLLLLAVVFGPEGADETAEYLDNVAADEAGATISTVLFLLAGLALVPGVLGLIRLGRDRRVTFAQIAASLVFLGILSLFMFYAVSVFELEMVDAAADRTEMVALSERAEEHGLAIVAFAFFLLGIVIGNILLAIALWRRGVLPIWGGAAIVLAVVLGFIAGDSTVVGAIAFLALLVGYGYLGLHLLRMPEEEWDRPAGAGASPVAPRPPA